jgi:cell wall-associated NlpC family hydrolase
LDIQRDKIVNYAKSFLGTKYKYAGNTPEEGFDCSGFTKYVFSKLEYDLPRRSADYGSVGQKTTLKDCFKADILLFTGSDKTDRTIGHVGIVVSHEADDIQFIHASTSRGVVISDMKVTYYKERILGVRRIINYFNVPIFI